MSDDDSGKHRYDAARANAIEARWQHEWQRRGTFAQPNPGESGFDPKKPKFYCLDMFPYPSGAGLHVGHPEGYTATDILCRYKRMRGHYVLHPMGWDAFGLPAEQYAIQTGVHPEVTTKKAIDTFRRQLQRFGFSYDWSREFGTIDPDYYRWTQWIFCQIYDAWFDVRLGKARPIADLEVELANGTLPVRLNPAATEHSAAELAHPYGSWATLDPKTRRTIIDSYRLAYVGEQVVNWCPKLGTALANEEVIDGRSERGGFPVLRKPLRQWMFRITAYAERLLEALARLDWPESTIAKQTDWIGKSEGAEIDFPLIGIQGMPHLRVYTTRPDTVFGATYMVVAPEHPLVEMALKARPNAEVAAYVHAAKNRADLDRQQSKEKTGVALGVMAVNPATGAQIPVYTADYVLMGYGHGAIMAVPGSDERDWEFAEKYSLPIVRVVEPADGSNVEGCFAEPGRAIHSKNAEVSLDGLSTADAKTKIIAWLEQKKLGKRRVNYKLRDWLFSRQRYWGEPFPVVWVDGAPRTLPEQMLPVELPEVSDFRARKPEAAGEEPQSPLAQLEDWVNTTDPATGRPARRETNTMPQWAGSCWYYLRFLDPRNPDRLVDPALEKYWMPVDLYIGGAEHAVLHLLYARFWHKVLYDIGVVSTTEPFPRLLHQGTILGDDGRKMSKSWGNVVNPDEVVDQFGADAVRMYEMFLGPLEASKPWNTQGVEGITRFLDRVWRLVVDENGAPRAELTAEPPAPESLRLLHQTIRKVTEDLDGLKFNTAIAQMMVFANHLQKLERRSRALVDPFLRLLSPFAPHLTEELAWRLAAPPQEIASDVPAPAWEGLTRAPWPAWDPAQVVEDTVTVAVQVNGKLRATLELPRDSERDAAQAAALADERVRRAVDGGTVLKVIYVSNKLLNLVVKAKEREGAARS